MVLDCKLCNGWSLTAFICDECYIIKNAMRLYGKDKLLNLVKKEFDIPDKTNIILKEEEETEDEDTDNDEIRPAKRRRFLSTNLYNNKKNESDNYHNKEISDTMLKELKDKLTSL